jgi:hypothetical protein
MTRMAEESTGHTGGMIALMPRAEDATAMAAPKGDPPEQLHLTLAYLGDDVSEMDTRLRNAIAAAVANVAVGLPPVQSRVFGHGTLNPDGYADRDPCAVYLVGDSDLIGPVRRELAGLAPGEQHEPFLAHVTAGYGVDQRKLSFTGPVVFDRLRVALGEEFYDFPLGEDMKGASLLAYIEKKRQRFKPSGQLRTTPDNSGDLRTAPDAAAKTIGTLAEWERFEAKVMSPSPNAARLREYWAHGPGRKKWNSFRSLRRHLAKYVQSQRILNGLTANIYKLATGRWPGRQGGEKSAMPRITAEEFKAAMLLADPDADLDDLGDLMGDEDGDGSDDPDEADTEADTGPEPEGEDDAYEQALADDFLWNIDADGQLEPDRDAPVDDEESEAGAEDSSVGPNSVTEAYSLF